MEGLYTEKKLKNLNKTELLKIAAANDIEADENTKNNDIMALILAKGCPLPPSPPAPDADKDKEKIDTEDKSVPKFTKEQLLKSNWYSHRRDVLTTLLEDGKSYSHAAGERLIADFMKGKVR
jgi:hypothetical protein